MSIYTKLLQAGLLPEFINYEQAEKVAAYICPDCFTSAIKDHIVKGKTTDNGDVLVNTLSLLEFVEQEDKKFIKKCKDERLLYLMEIKEGEIE